MEQVNIRLAQKEDAAAILAIYAPYITDTTITFEYEIPTLTAFRRRIEEIIAFYPYLVCEINGQIVGYAYAHRQLERAAYQWNAELSVYVAQHNHGKKIGTALYNALSELLAWQNVQNLYAIITLPNEKSVALHTARGFVPIGVFHHTGYKHGAWHDTVWMEKILNASSDPPLPLRSIYEVPQQQIEVILQKNTSLVQAKK